VQRVTGPGLWGRSTPKPADRSGGEATAKVCGVTVAMLSGLRRAPPSSIDSMVNVGTAHGRPPRRAAGPAGGQVRCRSMAVDGAEVP
jgi:hypothetical protein